ncbi:MAG: hypothetical protein ABI639_06625 [Thermoanaerobaculia bacterium]
MKKVLLAGLVGGLVIFFWGFLAHMVLPIGEMGYRPMPVNSPLLEAMKSNLSEPGLYYFPGKEAGRKQTKTEDVVWESKYKVGPTGLLLYHPTGEDHVSGKRLGIEMASDIAGALLLAYLLSALGGSIAKKIRFSVLAGIFGWVSISLIEWNWYGYPGAWLAGELIDQIVGWGLAGAVMAVLWRSIDRRAARLAAAQA